MLEIGRLCTKIAGRDAGKKCVVVDIIDNNYVLIDGETRRRKCNIMHLEASEKILKISKNDSTELLKPILEKENLVPKLKKSKKGTDRPKKQKKQKEKTEKKKKPLEETVKEKKEVPKKEQKPDKK